MSQTVSNGSERPVTYASRTLTPAERNYSQFEREALAIVFSVKKFHNYLSGMQFTIFTNYKTFLGIFGPEKAIPNMASSCMIRWTLILQGYSYELRHRAGSKHQNGDATQPHSTRGLTSGQSASSSRNNPANSSDEVGPGHGSGYWQGNWKRPCAGLCSSILTNRMASEC